MKIYDLAKKCGRNLAFLCKMCYTKTNKMEVWACFPRKDRKNEGYFQKFDNAV
jgi:hypothetical protein